MLLITGRKGQLGTILAAKIRDAIATDIEELDITDPSAVTNFVKDNNIDAIINCAAYTDVEKAEDEPQIAHRVNVLGPRYLAATGTKIIHLSTDYVFDGRKNTPYLPHDTPHPLNSYAKTKLEGEQEILKNPLGVVLRSSWLYSPYGRNFVKTMLNLGTSKHEISVINDQVGTPTCAYDLADAIVAILPQITKETAGIYHYSNLGQCSWHDFAATIMKLAKLNCKVNPISTKDYPTKATRPSYSVLDKTSIQQAFNLKIPTWQESLAKWLPQIQKQS